jgi:hypothetical protein
MLEADTKLTFTAIATMQNLKDAIRRQQEATDVADWVTPELSQTMHRVLHDVELATEPFDLKNTLVSIDYLDSIYSPTLPTRTMAEMLIDLDHLRNAFVSELNAITFLYLPLSRQQFYVGDDASAAPFGGQVLSAFPSAALDMREASNAFALERWPATVFHLMRVLEFGLAALGDRFGVNVERSTWHTAIEAIEGKIRKIDPSAGADWKQQQKDFSDAATQFMFFKDAWRNHVMHVRDTYDEGRTASIWQHVSEFMNKLTSIGLREN